MNILLLLGRTFELLKFFKDHPDASLSVHVLSSRPSEHTGCEHSCTEVFGEKQRSTVEEKG